MEKLKWLAVGDTGLFEADVNILVRVEELELIRQVANLRGFNGHETLAVNYLLKRGISRHQDTESKTEGRV